MLHITPTESTPLVLFDEATSEFMIKGRSFPEDAYDFFRPVLDWLNTYIHNPNELTALHVDLEYLNSSSVKQLLEIFSKMEELIKNGKRAKVYWYYCEGDELLETKGKEIQSVVEQLEIETVIKE
jgi:hypothetical protein